MLEGHDAAPIGLVVTGHTARDVYGYGYGEIWQPEAKQDEQHLAQRAAARCRAGSRRTASRRERTRTRTRLSWLR